MVSQAIANTSVKHVAGVGIPHVSESVQKYTPLDYTNLLDCTPDTVSW